MIVAVTGSSGFIGEKLVSKLLESGHDVIKLDLSEGIDILNWDELKKIKRFDVLVHLAAMSFVPLSYEKPREFYHLNINGVINGLELCRLNYAKFVFASSYVYGKPKYLPIDEDHPLEGFNPYAETKILGEKICENYFKYFKVPSIILRPFNVYGQGQNENFLISLILEQANTGILKLNDPKPKRDYVFIDDVANAFYKAVEYKRRDFETFNVGTGISYSVKEVTELVNKIYSNKLKVSFSNKQRNSEVLDTVADITKIKTVLNWHPTFSLKEGLLRMIER